MITKEQLKHLAVLSKIDMTDEELLSYSEQMTEIVELMDTIAQIDTSDIPSQNFESLPPSVFRGDIVMESLPLEKALENAPAKARGLFSVPKVMD